MSMDIILLPLIILETAMQLPFLRAAGWWGALFTGSRR